MKYLFTLGIIISFVSIAQETKTKSIETSMSVDDALKLEPYDAVILNKEMDIQANKLEYVDRELKIAEKLAKLRDINGKNNKKAVEQNVISNTKKSRIVSSYAPIKLISIWSESDNLVGLFKIGRTKIRLTEGEGFNGYEILQLDISSALVSRPKGGNIKVRM